MSKCKRDIFALEAIGKSISSLQVLLLHSKKWTVTCIVVTLVADNRRRLGLWKTNCACLRQPAWEEAGPDMKHTYHNFVRMFEPLPDILVHIMVVWASFLNKSVFMVCRLHSCMVKGTLGSVEDKLRFWLHVHMYTFDCDTTDSTILHLKGREPEWPNSKSSTEIAL